MTRIRNESLIGDQPCSAPEIGAGLAYLSIGSERGLYHHPIRQLADRESRV